MNHSHVRTQKFYVRPSLLTERVGSYPEECMVRAVADHHFRTLCIEINARRFGLSLSRYTTLEISLVQSLCYSRDVR